MQLLLGKRQEISEFCQCGYQKRRLQVSSDCRCRVCTANIHIINVPFTSKPPLYLSQPLSRILSPRISRNLSKPGLPLSVSNEKCSLGIDNAICYHLISHPPPAFCLLFPPMLVMALPLDNISSSVV